MLYFFSLKKLSLVKKKKNAATSLDVLSQRDRGTVEGTPATVAYRASSEGTPAQPATRTSAEDARTASFVSRAPGEATGTEAFNRAYVEDTP
jgi:hypothetical protein